MEIHTNEKLPNTRPAEIAAIPASRDQAPRQQFPQLAILYGAVIFFSAFLLFQVQPLITKIILPWFGGVAAVWTVCLVFFQVMLLLGYCYAHVLTSRVSVPTQGRIHAALSGSERDRAAHSSEKFVQACGPRRPGMAYL